MGGYQRLQIERVRNGYIVGPASLVIDAHLPNAHDINVFQDFDDLAAHLEMVLGDPAGQPPEHAKEQLDLLLRAIRANDTEMLMRSANRLKTEGGEDWAIGEMVERAVDLLEAEPEPEFQGDPP